MGLETHSAGFDIEARVWEKLDRGPKAAAALKEAWKRGDRAAFAKLSEKYPDALKEDGVAIDSRKAAVAFHATSLDGHEIDSGRLRGKVIVANFWFTGCGPCKAEISDLNQLVREFAGKDVVFLAFSTDEDDAMLRRFLKEYPFEYTIVPRAGEIASAFGVSAYPSHAIIGRDGKMESMLTGGGEHRAEELKTIIARLVR